MNLYKKIITPSAMGARFSWREKDRYKAQKG
jgi:predicted transposase YbfD/YdcC